MATLMHRGDEMFSKDANVDIGSLFASYLNVRSQVDDQVRALLQKQDEELIKLFDVDSSNLVFEQYRTHVAKRLDELKSDIVDRLKNGDGVLTTQDKMEIRKKREQIDAEVANFAFKSKEYLNLSQRLVERPFEYAQEKTLQEFEKFREDPIGSDLPKLYPAPKNLDVLTVSYFNRSFPFVAIQKKKSDGTVETTYGRKSLENIDDIKVALGSYYDNDREVQYSAHMRYNPDGKLTDDDVKQKYIEDELHLVDPFKTLAPETSSSRGSGSSSKESKLWIDAGASTLNVNGNLTFTATDNKVGYLKSIKKNDDGSFKVIAEVKEIESDNKYSTFAAFKANNPNAEYEKDDEGNFYVVRKQNKEYTYTPDGVEKMLRGLHDRTNGDLERSIINQYINKYISGSSSNSGEGKVKTNTNTNTTTGNTQKKNSGFITS